MRKEQAKHAIVEREADEATTFPRMKPQKVKKKGKEEEMGLSREQGVRGAPREQGIIRVELGQTTLSQLIAMCGLCGSDPAADA